MSATTLNLNTPPVDSRAENKLATVDGKLQKIDQQKSQLEAERQQILSEVSRKQEAERLEKIKSVAAEERRIVEDAQSVYKKLEAELQEALKRVMDLGEQVREIKQACESLVNQARRNLSAAGATPDQINEFINRLEPLKRSAGFFSFHDRNTYPKEWCSILKDSIASVNPMTFGTGDAALKGFEDLGKGTDESGTLVLVISRGPYR